MRRPVILYRFAIIALVLTVLLPLLLLFIGRPLPRWAVAAVLLTGMAGVLTALSWCWGRIRLVARTLREGGDPCPHCLYDLSRTPDPGPCPECAHFTTHEQRATIWGRMLKPL